MCTMVVILYNFDENVLNQKKLFFEEKNGQGVLYISRFFWIYQKLKEIKRLQLLRFFFLLKFLSWIWIWKLNCSLDWKLKIETWKLNCHLEWKIENWNLKIELSFRLKIGNWNLKLNFHLNLKFWLWLKLS